MEPRFSVILDVAVLALMICRIDRSPRVSRALFLYNPEKSSRFSFFLSGPALNGNLRVCIEKARVHTRHSIVPCRD